MGILSLAPYSRKEQFQQKQFAVAGDSSPVVPDNCESRASRSEIFDPYEA
jgi:hypothetical protein